MTNSIVIEKFNKEGRAFVELGMLHPEVHSEVMRILKGGKRESECKSLPKWVSRKEAAFFLG